MLPFPCTFFTCIVIMLWTHLHIHFATTVNQEYWDLLLMEFHEISAFFPVQSMVFAQFMLTLFSFRMHPVGYRYPTYLSYTLRKHVIQVGLKHTLPGLFENLISMTKNSIFMVTSRLYSIWNSSRTHCLGVLWCFFSQLHRISGFDRFIFCLCAVFNAQISLSLEDSYSDFWYIVVYLRVTWYSCF